MSDYYIVEPEVAGGWGKHTIFTSPPGERVVVHKLHYEFDGWLGDELLESTPCFIATERLAAEIEKAGLTGVSFDEVEISRSGEFEDRYPNRKLPSFLWMKVYGKARHDDFGKTPDINLVISQQALQLLREQGTVHMDVFPFSN